MMAPATPCLLWIWLAAAPDEAAVSRYREARPAMGATFEITLYAGDKAEARRGMDAAFERIEQLNRVFSDYDPESEAMRLSRASGTGQALAVSAEMRDLLGWSLRLSERTGGAFDVTVGPLSRLWRRARRREELPDPERLAEAKEAVGYEHLDLDSAAGTVQLERPGMRLDFGAVAKGRAADAALETLRERGITRALVNAGGDLAVGAPPPGEPGWSIGVAPLEPDEPPASILVLKDCGVATSGDAWQYVQIGAQRYSHIVDPRTGLGLTRRSGVTVVAPSGQAADGLASALSVLGPEQGVRLVERWNAAACRVVTVERGEVRTHDSRGWKDLPRAAAE